MRHGPADQGRRDVVEEAGKDPNHDEEDKGAFPVVRQESRQDHGHMALFEMAREQREADEQTKEVGEDDPLVAKMRNEARHTGASLEAGETELVDDDCPQAHERDAQAVTMENRHAEQREPEKNELDGNHSLSRGARSSRT